MQRAAEIILKFSHDRPKGGKRSGLLGYLGIGENLCIDTMHIGTKEEAFRLFREDDKPYGKQGDRRMTLSVPAEFDAVGIAFVEYEGEYFWVQEYGVTNSPNTKETQPVNGKKVMNVEIGTDYIEDKNIEPIKLTINDEDTKGLTQDKTVRINCGWDYEYEYGCVFTYPYSSNPAYITYNNDFFYSLYEGKAKGFGLPYNGLADYLHNSSYGKLGLSVGRIIDIQLENTFSSYIGEQGYINYFESDEYCKKLYEQVNIADYDSNSDGAIDALYLWNVTNDSLGEVWNVTNDSLGEAGGYVLGTRDQNTYHKFVSMFIPADFRNDESFILNVLIHETGHLLIDLPDYYMLKKYPKSAARVDIGSIMGWAQYEKGDYDAWSKWKANWLNNENVLYHELQDGETNTVELSPYDSDTDEGKKLQY